VKGAISACSKERVNTRSCGGGGSLHRPRQVLHLYHLSRLVGRLLGRVVEEPLLFHINRVHHNLRTKIRINSETAKLFAEKFKKLMTIDD
jgi:hypothetical protein